MASGVRVETGARDHSWKPLTTSSRPDACTDPCTRCRLRPLHASLIDRREMTSIYSAISLRRAAILPITMECKIARGWISLFFRVVIADFVCQKDARLTPIRWIDVVVALLLL